MCIYIYIMHTYIYIYTHTHVCEPVDHSTAVGESPKRV